MIMNDSLYLHGLLAVGSVPRKVNYELESVLFWNPLDPGSAPLAGRAARPESDSQNRS